MLNNRKVGIIIMALAVVLFIIGYMYISSVEQSLTKGHTLGEGGECVHDEGAVCPYAQLTELAMPKYVGLFADLALFAFGLFLFLKKEPKAKAVSKAKKVAKNLGKDESKVFNLISKSEGMVYQHELVKQTEFSKVKMTRILDKLEAKGLIERKRRGMANIVVLK